MKKLAACILFLFLITGTYVYSDEVKILREEKDHFGWTLLWGDFNGDGKCDSALLVTPEGEAYAEMSCDSADYVFETVKKNIEAAKRKGI